MKIIIYCQHVLGVGHFFRTLELTRAMEKFEVILITGGDHVEVPLPDHVRQVRLEGLMMDKDFSALHCVNPENSLDQVKEERKEALLDLLAQEHPDIFLIELYPFGRRAFRFELIPALEYLKGNCKIVCSLRDILVEKSDPEKYENRVITALNQWFDAVFVHSDTNLIRLDTTFSRLAAINVPLIYTGFVTPLPDPDRAEQLRKAAGIGPEDQWIIASAGGGNVGSELLLATAQAVGSGRLPENVYLDIYTGPYMDKTQKARLTEMDGPRVRVNEFARDFVSLLSAADLSISMGGYNTCMNIVAAQTPALVWPFDQNREQRQRAIQLARFAQVCLLENKDLAEDRLAELIREGLSPKKERPAMTGLNICGAANTAAWIEKGECFDL